jgi:hypothetical protein
MFRLASEPAGATVRDGQGRAIGKTPLELHGASDPLTVDLVVEHDGYQGKHLSLSFRDQSILVVLAREDVRIDKRRIAHSHFARSRVR